MIQNVGISQQRQNFGMALRVDRSITEGMPKVYSPKKVDKVLSALTRISNDQVKHSSQDLFVMMDSTNRLFAYKMPRKLPEGKVLDLSNPIPIKRGLKKLIYGSDISQIESASQKMALEEKNRTCLAEIAKHNLIG